MPLAAGLGYHKNTTGCTLGVPFLIPERQESVCGILSLKRQVFFVWFGYYGLSFVQGE